MKPGRIHWGRNSPGGGEFTRREFCQAVVQLEEVFDRREFTRGQFTGGEFDRGEFTGGNFPSTILLAVIILINTIFSSYSTNSKSIIVSTMIKSTS